eukprot:1237832-Amphidinium_carterae.1
MSHPSLAKALAAFIAFGGELERRRGALRLYHAVKAIPLRKAKNGIRPILLTTLFKKVNAKTLVATLTPLVAPPLKGRQFGLGQSEGCYLLTAAVMSRLEANPGMAACQLDVKNAFSSVHRARAIQAMLQRTPVAHSQLVKHLMPEHPIHIPGQQLDAASFATEHGLVQGDPLSTLLFCILYDTIVQQAHARFLHGPHGELAGVATPAYVAYIDDGIHLAYPDDLEQ